MGSAASTWRTLHRRGNDLHPTAVSIGFGWLAARQCRPGTPESRQRLCAFAGGARDAIATNRAESRCWTSGTPRRCRYRDADTGPSARSRRRHMDGVRPLQRARARGPQPLSLWRAEALAPRRLRLKTEALPRVAFIPTSACPAGWSEARPQGPIRRSSSTAVGPWPWRVPPVRPGAAPAEPGA